MGWNHQPVYVVFDRQFFCQIVQLRLDYDSRGSRCNCFYIVDKISGQIIATSYDMMALDWKVA